MNSKSKNRSREINLVMSDSDDDNSSDFVDHEEERSSNSSTSDFVCIDAETQTASIVMKPSMKSNKKKNKKKRLRKKSEISKGVYSNGSRLVFPFAEDYKPPKSPKSDDRKDRMSKLTNSDGSTFVFPFKTRYMPSESQKRTNSEKNSREGNRRGNSRQSKPYSECTKCGIKLERGFLPSHTVFRKQNGRCRTADEERELEETKNQTRLYKPSGNDNDGGSQKRKTMASGKTKNMSKSTKTTTGRRRTVRKRPSLSLSTKKSRRAVNRRRSKNHGKGSASASTKSSKEPRTIKCGDDENSDDNDDTDPPLSLSSPPSHSPPIPNVTRKTKARNDEDGNGNEGGEKDKEERGETKDKVETDERILLLLDLQEGMKRMKQSDVNFKVKKISNGQNRIQTLMSKQPKLLAGEIERSLESLKLNKRLTEDLPGVITELRTLSKDGELKIQNKLKENQTLQEEKKEISQRLAIISEKMKQNRVVIHEIKEKKVTNLFSSNKFSDVFDWRFDEELNRLFQHYAAFSDDILLEITKQKRGGEKRRHEKEEMEEETPSQGTKKEDELVPPKKRRKTESREFDCDEHFVGDENGKTVSKNDCGNSDSSGNDKNQCGDMEGNDGEDGEAMKFKDVEAMESKDVKAMESKDVDVDVTMMKDNNNEKIEEEKNLDDKNELCDNNSIGNDDSGAGDNHSDDMVDVDIESDLQDHNVDIKEISTDEDKTKDESEEEEIDRRDNNDHRGEDINEKRKKGKKSTKTDSLVEQSTLAKKKPFLAAGKTIEGYEAIQRRDNERKERERKEIDKSNSKEDSNDNDDRGGDKNDNIENNHKDNSDSSDGNSYSDDDEAEYGYIDEDRLDLTTKSAHADSNIGGNDEKADNDSSSSFEYEDEDEDECEDDLPANSKCDVQGCAAALHSRSQCPSFDCSQCRKHSICDDCFEKKYPVTVTQKLNGDIVCYDRNTKDEISTPPFICRACSSLNTKKIWRKEYRID